MARIHEEMISQNTVPFNKSQSNQIVSNETTAQPTKKSQNVKSDDNAIQYIHYPTKE